MLSIIFRHHGKGTKFCENDIVSGFILEQVIAISPGLLGALAAEDPLQYSNKRQLEVPIRHGVNHGVKGRVEVA